MSCGGIRLKKIWIKPQPVKRISDTIQTRLGLSPVVADILARRGVHSKKQVVDFLRPSLLNLHSPWAFREMNKAIERLELAKCQNEKVLIYGDYDVDGVTSTAMLYKVMKDLDFQTVAYIPNRMDEGYGLNKEAILKAAQAKVKVIITVDCGITAVEEVRYAKELGIQVILTDHHEPPEQLPEALAILNPKVPDSGYPFRELAGVGVAFKLAQALLERFADVSVKRDDILTELEILDIVAIGTIADIVPLIDENRVIVSYGLKQMEQTVHLGVQSLLEECGIHRKPIKSGQIAFLVAPRINAAGRMESAKAALELLITGNPERSQELARFLSRENAQRKDTEKEILEEALAMLEQQPLPRVIVLAAPHWHHGVIGIVASRLVERFYRPVYLLSEDGEEAKGSARGIQGYHVLNALKEQADLLERFGGHSQAAGFSLKCSNISALREGLNKTAEVFPEDLFYERVKVDQILSLSSVNGDLLSQLEQLAPFGFGNPSPVLAGEQFPLQSINTVGKDKAHLKCLFGSNGEWEGIAFRRGEEAENLQQMQNVDITFGLDWNTFRGPDQVQLILKDIEPEATWQKRNLTQDAAVQALLQGETEIAATSAEPLTGYDWRIYGCEQWLHALTHEAGITPEQYHLVRVWNGLLPQPGWISLDEFLKHPLDQDRVRGKVPPTEQDEPWIFILFLGLPHDWEEWQCINTPLFSEHLSSCWAIAQSKLTAEEVQRRAGYQSREKLIKIYRSLAQSAKDADGHRRFFWAVDDQKNEDSLEALKIFEELGLIKILGGTKRISIEWIPTREKLDLDSSLRYHVGKQTWENLRCFAEEFVRAPWSKLEKSSGSEFLTYDH
ncbi:single-stranded-DNA-specific exonuclease RecJ [Desulfitobacterium sp. Sab5]|uniref:single-stranded-DNA-specific exonuclease RecJ n=1 Tax=Desulfitobacterium nosdiversum TaxID=3375356 RepID=UPI003CE6A391